VCESDSVEIFPDSRDPGREEIEIMRMMFMITMMMMTIMAIFAGFASGLR